jgi:hypothetical protein
MKDDVRSYIYGTLTVFLVGVSIWLGIIFINACGFTLTCNRGHRLLERTPVPKLIPATLPAVNIGSGEVAVSDECRVSAQDLIGAWVEAGSPEKEAFKFTDANGQDCESTFDEVQPLFIEGNYWYAGSLSCVSCHSVDVAVSPAQLDLSSYEAIKAGSRRAEDEAKGTDILGGGNWENSLLYEFISTSKVDIPGHSDIFSDVLIYAGKPLPAPRVTATSTQAETSATPTP